MQVENIECQIAQAQIGNFLAGSGLSDEAMRQLEEHIAGCSSCKSVLTERRNELKAMLTGQKAVVDFEQIAREAESTKAKSIATALRKKSLQQMLEPVQEAPAVPELKPMPEPRAETPQPKAAVETAKIASKKKAPAETAPAKKPASNWKPLLYSGALAAVLVGMSLFSNNISSLFGPKLSDSNKVAAPTTPPANTETTPKVEPPVTTETADTAAVDPKSTEEAAHGTTGTDSTPTVTPSGTEATPKPADNPTPTEPTTVTPAEPEASVSAVAIGTTSGILATTQFDPVEAEVTPVEPPAKQPVNKPAPATVATKAPVTTKAPVARRFTPRRISKKPRRVIARRPVVRSRGIKVYNPN